LADLTQEQQTAYQQALADSLKTALADLVTQGTITQEQADQLSAAPSGRPGNTGN